MFKKKVLLSALSALCAVTLGITVGAAVGSAETSTPKTEYRSTSCTTNDSGVCKVAHSLGVVPSAIVVSPNTPGQFNAYILNTVRDSYTATDFKVRAMFNQATPKVNGTIWFTYIAYADGVPVPPPTSTTVAPPPTTSTTVVPPPTTSTTVPTTTPAPSGKCPNGASPDVITDGDGGTYGPYFVHNNTWNWGPGMSETLYACDYNNWWVDASGMKDGSVKTYPNVHLDIPDWHLTGKPLSTWPNAITGKFAGKGPGAGIYDVAWDLWLNGVADNNSTELMVWTENRNQTPNGDIRSQYTAGGVTYDVWWDGIQKGGYIAFVPRTALPSGTVDLKAMVEYSLSRGYMPANTVSNPTIVNQIDYGIEFCDTAGATRRFTLTDFSLTMN